MMRLTIDTGLSRRHRCWLGRVDWTATDVVEDPDRWGSELAKAAAAILKRFPERDRLGGNPCIAAAARAYEAYGLNPKRYPPASEALIKRVLAQKPLPTINT